MFVSTGWSKKTSTPKKTSLKTKKAPVKPRTKVTKKPMKMVKDITTFMQRVRKDLPKMMKWKREMLRTATRDITTNCPYNRLVVRTFHIYHRTITQLVKTQPKNLGQNKKLAKQLAALKKMLDSTNSVLHEIGALPLKNPVKGDYLKSLSSKHPIVYLPPVKPLAQISYHNRAMPQIRILVAGLSKSKKKQIKMARNSIVGILHYQWPMKDILLESDKALKEIRKLAKQNHKALSKRSAIIHFQNSKWAKNVGKMTNALSMMIWRMAGLYC